MQKAQILTHAAARLQPVLDGWDALCRCADYGVQPLDGRVWGGVRESTLETLARSLLAAVPLIVNRRDLGGQLAGFYAAQIGALAQDPLYAPRLDRYDQASVEVAGLCACLLTLEAHGHDLLASLQPGQHQAVVDWVRQHAGARFMDNNWQLFALLMEAWLARRGGGGVIDLQRWQRVDRLHVGQGFYRDGPNGAVDYYTHWSFQWYSLILVWAGCTDDAVAQIVRQRGAQFAAHLSSHLARGPLPVAGRSQCYREAASAALALVARVAQPLPGGHRLMEVNWRQWEYSHGFDGVPREFYSCTASPMWRFKWYWQALLPDDDVWWTSP